MVDERTPMLSLRGVTRRFGGLTAVDNVSLDFAVGELHAVIGTNGAGKSTLINMLSGEIAASGGQILLGAGALRAAGFFTKEWALPTSFADPLAKTRRAPAAVEPEATTAE